MATYIIRVPEDSDDAYQLNQLLNALEHFHGIASYNALVVVTEGNELAEVLGPRAEHIISELEVKLEVNEEESCDCSCLVGRPAVDESFGRLAPAGEVELPVTPENQVTVSGMSWEELSTVKFPILTNGETLSRTVEVTFPATGPLCEACGEPIDKKKYNSKRFCSARCYMRAYQKKYKPKKNTPESEASDE